MMVHADNMSPVSVAAARAICPAAFESRGPARLRLMLLWGGIGVFTLYCFWHFGLSPLRLAAGAGKFIDVVSHMFPPSSGGAAQTYVYAVLQTVAMAFIGTVIAAILAVPLGMMCARNVVPNWLARFVFRRSSDTLRGIDQLIWALIFVRAVGLGPLAGILAIIISDVGTLAKLYSEAIENVEKNPIEGVRAAGGSPVQAARFGIIPQILPVMVSNALYIFESNTRSATILGIVGAGGIGFYLADRIRTLLWEEASFIMILILVAVYLIDWISRLIRTRLIGVRETATAVH